MPFKIVGGNDVDHHVSGHAAEYHEEMLVYPAGDGCDDDIDDDTAFDRAEVIIQIPFEKKS